MVWQLEQTPEIVARELSDQNAKKEIIKTEIMKKKKNVGMGIKVAFWQFKHKKTKLSCVGTKRKRHGHHPLLYIFH
jgi:hypothetical protein